MRRSTHVLGIVGLGAWLLFVLLLVVAALVQPKAAARKPVHARCMHGASSIYAYTDQHGKLHVSKPTRTGC